MTDTEGQHRVVIQPDGHVEYLSHEFPTIPDSVWLGYFAGQALVAVMSLEEFAVHLGTTPKIVGAAVGIAEAMLAELKKREGQDA